MIEEPLVDTALSIDPAGEDKAPPLRLVLSGVLAQALSLYRCTAVPLCTIAPLWRGSIY